MVRVLLCTEPRGLSIPVFHVHDLPDSRISEAVKDCLARCYAGGTPLGVIAESLHTLREEGWPEADIRKVEVTVRRVLAGVVADEHSDNDTLADG